MEESEGEQTGSDGVRDGKGRRRGCTMTSLISVVQAELIHLAHACPSQGLSGIAIVG